MADSSQKVVKETDVIYKRLMDRCSGDQFEQAAAFCDEVFDFMRRNSRTLHNKRCQALIKQSMSKHFATAVADFENPNRHKPKFYDPRFPDAKSQKEVDDRKEFERLRKIAEEQEKEDKKQVEEIEELDPSTLQPKKEDAKIVVDDEEEESGELPNAGNGGKEENYTWTQTLDAVDLQVEVPAHVKGRNLKVDVHKDRIYVGLKGEAPLIAGELHAEVQESMWTLESENGKKFICINMDKREGMCWWKRVVKGHVGIQTKKIQPENSKLGDLDGETRQTVEKMMFDQRQRERGLPTSKEANQRKMLSKFMEAHPELDFSNAKFGGPGGGSFGGMM